MMKIVTVGADIHRTAQQMKLGIAAVILHNMNLIGKNLLITAVCHRYSETSVPVLNLQLIAVTGRHFAVKVKISFTV